MKAREGLGLVNLAIGLVLWAIPGGFPNKRQSTMSWAVISMAVIIAGLLAFVYTDWKDADYSKLNQANKARIVLFNAFGQNPFLIFIMAEVFGGILDIANITLEPAMAVLYWIAGLSIISFVAIMLYLKGKVISTTKIALFVIVLLLTVGLLLIGLDIIEL
jgi:hypothetical protein